VIAQPPILETGMNEIKMAKWRFFLIVFLFLTLASMSVECFSKTDRSAFMLVVLRNAVLPGLVTIALYLVDWLRDK